MTSAQYKAGRKEEGGGVTLGPLRQPLRVLEPCFLRRPDIACSWEVENKSVFFFLLPRADLCFALLILKLLVFYPQGLFVFLSYFLSPLCPVEKKKGKGREVIERLGGYLAFSQGQTTTVFWRPTWGKTTAVLY